MSEKQKLTLKKLEKRIEELETELKHYKTSTLQGIREYIAEAGVHIEDKVREVVREEIEDYVDQYKPSPKAVARRKRIIYRTGGLF